MKTLSNFIDSIRDQSFRLIDLTSPLSEKTPVIQLPPHLGQAFQFKRQTISHYDAAGPDAYWNNLWLSEHTGTHFDAPVHWVSGKDLDDVSRVPVERLIAPAAVLDFSREASLNPDFLLRRDHVEAWQQEFGPLPENGWLLFRTGWDARSGSVEDFLNGGHSPGLSAECARWLAQETTIVGLGVETVGTDAGQAGSFGGQTWPCHWYFLGANKYGVTQLRNLAQLPPLGAVVMVCPLPIVGGSGSPCRVIAFTENKACGDTSGN